ncbi:MAG: response regulator, partial [Anaerolineales bacterium]|nr:response regulator [Anaerolineales bacterium]
DQALEMAAEQYPDLIILDLNMPGMDGYELTRRLRALPATISTPIIMFCAKSQWDDRLSGYELGVDDFLAKPTQPRELFAHVKAVIARGRKGAPAAPIEPARGAKGYVIGLLAAKGGLGSTTIAMNLGISLKLRSKARVVVAEMRPGEGSLALDLGVQNPAGLTRLLNKQTSDITAQAVDAELTTQKADVKTLLASYAPGDARLAAYPEKFEAVARHLANARQFVILDMGPAISPSSAKMLPLCDEVLLILEPWPQIVLRTQQLAGELVQRGFGEARLHTILYRRSRSEDQLSLALVQQIYTHPIAVVFTPAPELACQSSKANNPMVLENPDSLTGQQFFKLADLVMARSPIEMRT